jgi:hypothetical protein
MMEKPITLSPKFWPFSSHIRSQSRKILQLKFLIDSLYSRKNLPVHVSSNIETTMSIVFTFDQMRSCFYRSRWSGRLPLARSLSGLRVVHIAPTFVTRDDFRIFGPLSICFFKSWHKIKRVLFWFFVSRRGTNIAASHLMFKSTVKIRWQALQLTPVASEISSIVYRGPSLIFLEIFWHSRRYDLMMAPRIRIIFNTHFSSVESRKQLENLCTCSASSLKALWSITWASVVIFPRRKTNLKQIRCSVRSDITISREELDNTWENWQHKPVQTSTSTSAWLLTRERCNYTHLAGNTHLRLGRVSEASPVLLGLPSYVGYYITLCIRTSYFQKMFCLYKFLMLQNIGIINSITLYV